MDKFSSLYFTCDCPGVGGIDPKTVAPLGAFPSVLAAGFFGAKTGIWDRNRGCRQVAFLPPNNQDFKRQNHHTIRPANSHVFWLSQKLSS
jgi:hypothetical protein